MQRTQRRLGAWAAVLATAVLLWPVPRLALATEPVAAPAQILDVQLAEGGILNGQILNTAGQPLVNAAVTLLINGQPVAETTSHEGGQFQFVVGQGGLYVVSSPEVAGVYRLWMPQTAPPTAKRGVLLVVGSDTERGNHMRQYGVGAVLVIGVVAAIIAVSASRKDKPPAS